MSAKELPSLSAGRPSASRKATTLADMSDKAATVRVNFDLDRAEHMKLKIHAARTGRTIVNILRELVAGLE